MRILVALILASTTLQVHAQTVPVPRDGRKPCPYGFTGSGAFCTPVSDR
jgi:hypothetical protein